MRTVRIALFAFLAICSTSAVWAQGLYGSPETLQVPQQESSPFYAAPTNYPTTATTYPTTATTYPAAATPRPQPAPTQAYYPAQPQYRYPAQPQYGYSVQPQYRYPAQASATTTYQPRQPGSQYCYPSPNMRRPVRMAAVESPAPIQPIPAPPGMFGPESAVPAPVPNAPAPQDSGMMNQMLAEQGGCYGGENGCGANRGSADCSAEGCGLDAACGQGYCPWYASVSGLVLGRSDSRRLWTSNEPYPNERNQIANTDFPLAWKWGGEAQFGRRFCCGCTPYALEATFWSTEAFYGSQTTTNPNTPYTVSTPLRTENISFNLSPVPQATDFFDHADSHTLTRRDEFYNFELNLIREQLAWASDSPWDIGWSLGVRYFRFQETLSFSAINSTVSGTPGVIGSAYFRDEVTNNLVGVQFGFDAAYNVVNNVRLFITPSVGIYNNFLDSNFDAKARYGSGDYVNGIVDPALGYPNFPAHGTTNGVAFLTQIDVGADWQFTRNWGARVGYRVVAISGVGMADDQFPQYLCDTPEMGNPQHTSSLVLHGAFLGLTYNF